ncbi:hypothetical protein [Rhizobium grahamii]|uniref:hypothetical protein n=1 Tax=Rhizobium grahamii TaxID=1120045 RepID=UPI0016772E6A|nr:hypothetical protein [Rhizobium grahamii]
MMEIVRHALPPGHSGHDGLDTIRKIEAQRLVGIVPGQVSGNGTAAAVNAYHSSSV